MAELHFNNDHNKVAYLLKPKESQGFHPIMVCTSVLETITSPIRDDDTGGGSFHKSLPSPPPATPTHSPTVGVAEEPLTLTSMLALFPTYLQCIATLEAELKATKILHRDTVVLFAKRIKKLESKLKTKKRKLVLSDSENEEEARHVSAGGADPADVSVSIVGADSAGTFISAGVSIAAGPSVPFSPSSPIRDPTKGKAIATPSSPITSLSAKELVDQQARVAEEQERESRASAVQPTSRQAELDMIALNHSNEEWIGLVDQVRANLTLSAELLGVDVSKDTFSVRMVALMDQRRQAIAAMKAKAKRDKPLTPAQQKEYMRAFVKNQSIAIYTTGWTWKDVRGLTDDQLQNVYTKIRRAVDLATAKDHHQLEETTSFSVGATVAAADPISVVPFVSVVPSVFVASSIPAETPIAASVFTTAGVSDSTGVASPVPLRKSSRKKSMARRRTLPRPSPSESAALLFDEDDPEAEFKQYLRQVFDDNEPAEPVSLSLVFDIRTWEIIPTEFGLGKIHVITRADGTVKRFTTLRELMYWVGQADLMVLYGMVSDKYKLEIAIGIGLGLWSDLRTLITAREDRDVSYGMIRSSGYSEAGDFLKVCRALTMSARVLNCLTFKLEEIVMAMMTCLKSSGVHYQCFTVEYGLLWYLRCATKLHRLNKAKQRDSRMIIVLQVSHVVVDPSCCSTLNPHTALMRDFLDLI
nr:JmjC domain-containing protein [Tanacetum cinerariifolium]